MKTAGVCLCPTKDGYRRAGACSRRMFLYVCVQKCSQFRNGAHKVFSARSRKLLAAAVAVKNCGTGGTVLLRSQHVVLAVADHKGIGCGVKALQLRKISNNVCLLRAFLRHGASRNAVKIFRKAEMLRNAYCVGLGL